MLFLIDSDDGNSYLLINEEKKLLVTFDKCLGRRIVLRASQSIADKMCCPLDYKLDE